MQKHNAYLALTLCFCLFEENFEISVLTYTRYPYLLNSSEPISVVFAPEGSASIDIAKMSFISETYDNCKFTQVLILTSNTGSNFNFV